MARLVPVAVLAIAALSLTACHQAPTPPRAPRLPLQERDFLGIVAGAQVMAQGVKNQIRLAEIKGDKTHAVCALLKSPDVHGWIGHVQEIHTSLLGDGVVTLKLAQGVQVATWNNGISDFGDHTMIPKGSPLFNSLATLSIGQQVKFSGAFAPSDGCPQEQNFSTMGGLEHPVYVFRFTSIKADSPGG